MANVNIPTVVFDLDKPREASFSLDAVRVLREQAGISVFEASKEMAIEQLSQFVQIAINDQIDDEKDFISARLVGRHIGGNNMEAVAMAIKELLEKSFHDAAPEDDEKKVTSL